MRAVLSPSTSTRPVPTPGSRLHTLRARAWARLVGPRAAARTAIDGLQPALQAELDEIVAQMSHWEPDSLLSRYNRAPAGTLASRCRRTVLRRGGLRAVGAYDDRRRLRPGRGRAGRPVGLRRRRGATTRPGSIPGPAKWAPCWPTRGGAAVVRPRRAPPATSRAALILDLSSVAKGYAVDRLAQCAWKAGLAALPGRSGRRIARRRRQAGRASVVGRARRRAGSPGPPGRRRAARICHRHVGRLPPVFRTRRAPRVAHAGPAHGPARRGRRRLGDGAGAHLHGGRRAVDRADRDRSTTASRSPKRARWPPASSCARGNAAKTSSRPRGARFFNDGADDGEPLRSAARCCCPWAVRGLSFRMWSAHRNGGAMDTKDADWLVVHASQTGSAELLAKRSAALLATGGLRRAPSASRRSTATGLAAATRVLFIASTYGEGDAPDTPPRSSPAGDDIRSRPVAPALRRAGAGRPELRQLLRLRPRAGRLARATGATRAVRPHRRRPRRRPRAREMAASRGTPGRHGRRTGLGRAGLCRLAHRRAHC
jgi:hypothetical protein